MISTRPLLAALALLFVLAPGLAAQSAPAALATTPAVAPAAAAALPPGVLKVRFGTAVRDRTLTGVARCTIPEPLAPPPRFEPGIDELSYVIDVDPTLVKSVQAKVVGNLGCPEPWSKGCPGYTVCGAGVCQNQYGATLNCPDGKPLPKGSYRLAITLYTAADPAHAGPAFEVPFEIQ